MWSYSVNHMLHGAVARIGGAIKRIEGADGAKYSHNLTDKWKYVCESCLYQLEELFII